MLERPLLPGTVGKWMGAPQLPEEWVDRSYPQARPPLWLDLPVEEILDVLPEGEVLVLSENPVWTETYATLHLRERLATRRVWQVIGNPQRAVETAHQASAFLYIGDGQLGGWPSEKILSDLLEQEKPGEEIRWPLPKTVATAEKRFVRQHVFQWTGGEAALWVSRALVERGN